MDYQYLNSSLSVQSLKKLDINELQKLASEIRHRIIDVLSVTGGHLASNLGAVELTLALHYVFNSPEDKFIWDVSHQTYVHKILTGRNDRFHTIRQTNGLCGFSHPNESEHDHFHAGHAGTALSLGLGVAKMRDLQSDNFYVLPIIGDATLTCGMSLEALNNMSRDLKRFIVILNDNEMSISKNVGAIKGILSRMFSNPKTNRFYQEMDQLVSKVPGFGSLLSRQGHRIKESFKNLFSPAAFFEHFGLSYIGPIDGHDIRKLIDSLEGVKDSGWPVIIHALTTKGHGMEEAAKNPEIWHGAKPFSVDTCKFLPSSSTKPTFPKVFGSHLLMMAEKDESIVCVTPAMSQGSQLNQFMEAYPDRFFDVGIAESHSITFCGGLAYGNKLKVFGSIYSTFLQRALDNVFHDVCLQELNIVFAIDRAGIAGGDGVTHNGIYDISFLNAMPNMIICQPRDGDVLRDLMESAHQWKHPVAIRYPNLATNITDRDRLIRKPGKGEILIEGHTLLIISLGHMTETALTVSKMLKEDGISSTVLDPIFVKPLDTELLESLLKTHHLVVTIEEHSAISGLGAIINNFLMSKEYSHLSVLNLGVPETFIEHGKHKELMDQIGLSPNKIKESILHQFQDELATHQQNEPLTL